MKFYAISLAILISAEFADAATVTYTFSGRIPSAIASEFSTSEIDPELSALVGRRFSYSATVDPDAPVDLASETFGFVGQTTVTVGRQTFEQSSDQAVSKTSVSGAGSSFFGATDLDGSMMSPLLSDFDFAAAFEFFTFGDVPASSTLPLLADFTEFDNGFFTLFAFREIDPGPVVPGEPAVNVESFSARALIDTVTVDGEARSFANPGLTPSFDGATVPLPASLPLLLVGLAGIWSIRRSRA